MARLVSKSRILASIAVLLFVTLAAFFDTLPRKPYHGSSALNLNTPGTASKDNALNGAQAEDTHSFIPAETTSVPTPEVTKVEEEKEKDRGQEEEMEKLREAAKIAKLLNFSVPANITYDPAGPRPDQIILLCAADGKGHQIGIENILETTRQNRQAYADLHGYTYHFLNSSKYDIGGAHPVWAKLPAIAETFETFPKAQWVWWLDLDAILMTPAVDLNEHLLSYKALEKQTLKGEVFNIDGNQKTGIFTPDRIDVKNIDLIFSQDHNGINAGSFFIRRSQWSRWFLDIWADPLFVTRTWMGREQETVSHLIKHHPTIMQHFGLVGQRVLNSYPYDGSWTKGDLVVHLAGCWVNNECTSKWEKYFELREPIH